MNIVDYLNKSFPSVKLDPSIYYQWDIGIHFSLGKGIYQFNENDELNLELFRIVYKQVSTIFNELFEPNDDLFLVTNFYNYKAKLQKTRKLKV